MKRIFVTITLAAAAAWIMAIPAAAQGSSQSHHGSGSAAAGSMGGGHGMDASGKSTSETSGPRTPDQLLTQNTQLSSKLSGLLPTGTDLQTAATGYRNLGQFVAAVHVSHNLDIPFAQLKCTELAPHDELGGQQGSRKASGKRSLSRHPLIIILDSTREVGSAQPASPRS